MTYVPFRMAGRTICAHTKKWGFKNISNKIKSIKGEKKRRWSIGKRLKLRMKRKTNYTEKRKINRQQQQQQQRQQQNTTTH